jgi:hypothetical protein
LSLIYPISLDLVLRSLSTCIENTITIYNRNQKVTINESDNNGVTIKINELYAKLDKHESGEEWLDDLDLQHIRYEIDELDEINKTDYHDMFRTSKRNADNTYTDDVLFSKQECDNWLEENSETIYYMDKDYLDRFWNEYPDGVIYFG